MNKRMESYAMRTGTVNMTSGNVRRVMISFALPILLSQLFQQLYNTADSLIVGNLLGKQALAAVSSSTALQAWSSPATLALRNTIRFQR